MLRSLDFFQFNVYLLIDIASSATVFRFRLSLYRISRIYLSLLSPSLIIFFLFDGTMVFGAAKNAPCPLRRKSIIHVHLELKLNLNVFLRVS